MKFELPELEYAYNALEPNIDAKTMEIHHSKHHNGYTNNLNNAIEGTELEGKNIEEICKSEGLSGAVRNNGGGFTADHLLTVLVPPVHASTVPRGGGSGYPGDRRVYATWTKPIVVLCNERSFSNAEIFSHAIKNLKRGKLVGVPTAGGVISTASRSIMDLGTIRMPGRGWFLPDGQDMELNGAIPDYLIWPLPGELPSGDDKQLDKAVQVLMSDVEKVAKESKTKLIPASQRKATETEASQ